MPDVAGMERALGTQAPPPAVTMEPDPDIMATWTKAVQILDWVKLKEPTRSSVTKALALDEDDGVQPVAALTEHDVKHVTSTVIYDGVVGLPPVLRTKVELFWVAAQLKCGVRWRFEQQQRHAANKQQRRNKLLKPSWPGTKPKQNESASMNFKLLWLRRRRTPMLEQCPPGRSQLQRRGQRWEINRDAWNLARSLTRWPQALWKSCRLTR